MDKIGSWIVYLACGVAAALLAAQDSMAQTKYRAFDLNRSAPYGGSTATVGGGQAAGFVIDAYTVGNETRYCRRAVYWANAASAPIVLNSSGSSCSDVRGMSGVKMVGAISFLGSGNSHAVLWNGVGVEPSDVSSSGFQNSWANGIHGNQVVGQASGAASGGHLHAVLWDIQTRAISDLNGEGHLESAALATNGRQQAGWATDEYGEGAHAVLWSGSHHVCVDLNPETFDSSYAYAMDAKSQAGVGILHNSAHALLWHGQSDSVVDLNPPGFIESYATGVSGDKQVGYAIKADLRSRALVWSGKASAYADLQAVLPPALTQSYATSIDASGDIGGYATEADGTPHAIIWRPVPAKGLAGTRLATR